jgi:hypothetical protein
MSSEETKLKNFETLNKKFLISELMKFMSIIGNHKNMTGKEKKDWVLLKLREEMDFPDIIEDLIIATIDYIVLIDKGQIKINPKIKKNFFKCC